MHRSTKLMRVISVALPVTLLLVARLATTDAMPPGLIPADPDAIVARGATHPTLLLVAAFPAPPALRAFHADLNSRLRTSLDVHAAHAHMYNPEELHVTIATLRAGAVASHTNRSYFSPSSSHASKFNSSTSKAEITVPVDFKSGPLSSTSLSTQYETVSSDTNGSISAGANGHDISPIGTSSPLVDIVKHEGLQQWDPAIRAAVRQARAVIASTASASRIHAAQRSNHGSVTTGASGASNIIDDGDHEPGQPTSRFVPSLVLSHGEMSDAGVGTLRYHNNVPWLAALRQTLRAAAPPECAPPRIPGIVHSSVLRWRSPPGTTATALRATFEDAVCGAAAAAGKRVAGSAKNGAVLEIPVPTVRMVMEERPFMRDVTILAEYNL